MLDTYQAILISDRKQQILQEAINIIASEGYGKLTMRALARTSRMKLGALQYHFRTRDDILRALAAFIAKTYRQSFEDLKLDTEVLDLRDTVILTSIEGESQTYKPGETFVMPKVGWAHGRCQSNIERRLSSKSMLAGEPCQNKHDRKSGAYPSGCRESFRG